MAEFEFPAKRLSDAGASAEEVEQLQREFDSSGVDVQKGIDEFYRGLSESALREQVDQLRERGHFKGTPAEAFTSDDESEVSGTTPDEVVSDASATDEDDQTHTE